MRGGAVRLGPSAGHQHVVAGTVTAVVRTAATRRTAAPPGPCAAQDIVRPARRRPLVATGGALREAKS